MPSSYALRNSRALNAAAACDRAKAWAQRRRAKKQFNKHKLVQQEEAGRIENWLISSPAKKKKTEQDPYPPCDEEQEAQQAGEVVEVVHT